MKFSIKGFFSKSDQIRSFLWIWSHLLKKPLMENFIFCAVLVVINPQSFGSKKYTRSLSGLVDLPIYSANFFSMVFNNIHVELGFNRH